MRWGTGPAGGFAAARRPLTPPGGHHRRARRADLGRAAPSLQLAGAGPRRARRRRGRLGRGDVPQPPRVHRRLDRDRQARRRHPLPQHRLRRARSSSTCSSARRPAWSIHDEEFTGLLAQAPTSSDGCSAWTDGDGPTGRDAREPRARRTTRATCTRPTRHARIVILTSGTTGTPKGAPRKEAGIDAAVSLLSRMPLRAGWRTHIAAPLFHTWGFAHLALAMLLGSTVVLRRTFDPETALRTDAGRALPVDGRDPGDAPADARARARRARRHRPRPRSRSWRRRARRCRPRWRRPGWTASATTSTTSTARPRSPTPRSRRPRTCAPTRPRPASRRYGTVVKILDEDGDELPVGRDRADLRRQRAALRGLHRRRVQGGHRRADVLGRRRLLRRATGACTWPAATTT